ncbi:autotransporter domain-containing protein, partial [Burkholderia sp. Ax-1735]|uniref:beta strand repeat-containing protein n=1 Tax=Burkholderia sp. Ax-1735 TaxID=2608329 RepID=UPI0034E2FD96|nr:autotransporter domain-containing protein [Burkholderia sp. Ax-1735]
MRMRMGSNKKRADARPKFLVPTGMLVALVGAGVIPAEALAACTGTPAVTCTGATASYANGTNGLNVTVAQGATVSVLPLFGGTAMSLTGSGVTLTNNGTIDPSLAGLSAVSNGTVVGNVLSPSTVNVTNTSTGVMMGSTSGLLGNGPALTVYNGIGGTTNITNAGTIGTTGILGFTAGPTAQVVTAQGGAQVNFTNASGGAINGSVVLAPSGLAGTGNTFTNAGTITGNVSLGAGLGTSNTFNALTGSSVGLGVDAGVGGNNTLNLQLNPAAGGATNGAIAVDTFGNFNNLAVQGGTWDITGASTAANASLTGGTAIVHGAGALGTGTIVAGGGTLEAGAAGVNLLNNVTLNGSLTVDGANGLALSGTIAGGGALNAQ